MTLFQLSTEIHEVTRAKGYWTHEELVVRDPVLGDVEGRPSNPSILPEKIAFIHSEVSEALEKWRDGDDRGMALELIDTLMRTLDLFPMLGFNPDDLWREKMKIVKARPPQRRWKDRLQ